MSLSIKIITGCVLVAIAGFAAASIFSHWTLVVALLLGAVSLGCYLRAPVAYELSGNDLVVLFRMGSKQFGPLLGAGPIDKSVGKSIRVWGNGGLFAGTGIFWNSAWGTFRAYVTTSDRSNMVVVSTSTGKVLVSPEQPEAFTEVANSLAATPPST
jgi:hypothetical protein